MDRDLPRLFRILKFVVNWGKINIGNRTFVAIRCVLIDNLNSRRNEY